MREEKSKEVLELQVPTTLKNLIEALVFAAKEPLTFKQMKDIYDGEGSQSYLRQLDAEEVEASINELNADYEHADKPYRIVRIAGGYQFATLSSYADWIGRLYREQGRRKLSQSAIESLAIIAYKQPVTKSDIESIRGVNCDYVLKTLLEKELVTIVGRAHAPGRPLLYGTTREFLKHFGLNEITDLPRPREIEEILGESQFETERRMLEAQAGAQRMKEEEPDFKSRLPHIPKKKAELDSLVEIRTRTGARELKTVLRTEIIEETNGTELSVAEPENAKPQDIVPGEIESQIPESALEVLQPALPTPTVDETTRGITVAQDDMVPGNRILVEDEPVSVDREDGDGSQSSSIQDLPDDTLTQNGEPNSYTKPVFELHEEVQDDKTEVTMLSQPAVNKTKWQTWKEKVQGFIRKLFG